MSHPNRNVRGPRGFVVPRQGRAKQDERESSDHCPAGWSWSRWKNGQSASCIVSAVSGNKDRMNIPSTTINTPGPSVVATKNHVDLSLPSVCKLLFSANTISSQDRVEVVPIFFCVFHALPPYKEKTPLLIFHTIKWPSFFALLIMRSPVVLTRMKLILKWIFFGLVIRHESSPS